MLPTGWHDQELLGFDLETTGIDRFFDVPVSFALVTVVGGGVVERRTSLVDPGREIPEGATAIHGITSERARADGMALTDAVVLLADAIVAASRRGIPIVGMKLDYDLTILDFQCRQLDGPGLADRGFAGPVLDALVLDRRFDRYRKGRRTARRPLCGVRRRHRPGPRRGGRRGSVRRRPRGDRPPVPDVAPDATGPTAPRPGELASTVGGLLRRVAAEPGHAAARAQRVAVADRAGARRRRAPGDAGIAGPADRPEPVARCRWSGTDRRGGGDWGRGDWWR